MKTISITIKLDYYLIILVLSFLFADNNLYPQDNTTYEYNQLTDSTLIHRQHMIHDESPLVMPFDMNKVIHYFIKNDSGGVLTIKVKKKMDSAQAPLIQSHLKKECTLFSNADFRDPKALHGMNMPGLKILTESKGKYNVKYKKLSDGAQLIFTSKDSVIINAIHLWFDAQLRDHGTDAKSRLE
jgi:hypothetical protein